MTEVVLMFISIAIVAFFIMGALGMVLTVLRNVLACVTLLGFGLIAFGLVTREVNLAVFGGLLALCCYPVWSLLSPAKK